MTYILSELADRLMEISVGGFFNNRKLTKEGLMEYIDNMMANPERMTIPYHFVATIALKDGWWSFEIEQRTEGEYDFWIPNTREQERAMNEKYWKAYEARCGENAAKDLRKLSGLE